MKSTTFKALFMVILLFTSHICYTDADEIDVPAVKSDNVNSQIDITKLPKAKAATATPEGVPGNRKSRAIGNAIMKHNADESEDVSLLKKRLEELEIIVKEQNKLIEMYKEKQNDN